MFRHTTKYSTDSLTLCAPVVILRYESAIVRRLQENTCAPLICILFFLVILFYFILLVVALSAHNFFPTREKSNGNAETLSDLGTKWDASEMNKQLLQTLPMAKGKDVYNRTAKLALYKECIALAASVSDPLVRQRTLAEVREKWLQGRGDGGQTLQLQLASALDRIAYGRMCVSKQRLRLIPNASEKFDWDVVNPMENHALRIQRRAERESPDAFPHGSGKRDFVPMTNWGYGNMDPDAVMRHKELTDRQHFMGPHWRNKPKPVLLEDLSFEEQMYVQFQSKPKMKKTPKKHY
ncbi:hypothetical protein ERJ75_000714400 [Trypanosoma vivax]|uniref:Uncharacterized protein n=1 Tax=Trypanosoma vivax (strain Y486) TaxID=1055687 RepID=G0TTS8_TRYVY|nr:hypothetical protein ERJ75_000714400 [Trypanosoma vivax]CCC47359.1 conserved hypothetical protein [Trypanosoma vivax Y486]